MYKRARSSNGSLTGGTGDVNPQQMRGTLTLTGAGTFTQLTLPIPRQVLQQGNRAQVIEVLKIFIDRPLPEGSGSTSEVINEYALAFSTKPQTVLGNTASNFSFADAAIFAFDRVASLNAFTTGGTYTAVYDNTRVIDLTDGSGHGLLIGTDNIYICGDTAGVAAAVTWEFRILYRWKNVGMTEYVGMVQSQQ